MFFPLDEFASVLTPDNVSCVAMAGHAARIQAVIVCLAFAALFTLAPRAQAEQPLPPSDSGDVIFISDAQSESSWLNLKFVPRLAFRDDWYAGDSAPNDARPQPATPNGSADLPLMLPPPMAPAPAENDALSLPHPAQLDGSETRASEPSTPNLNAEAADPNSAGEPISNTKVWVDDCICDAGPQAPQKSDSPDKKPVIADFAKNLIEFTNGDDETITFMPGLRIQPRFIYEEGNDNNDFLLRRFRLKGKGNAFEIGWYNVELKIDNTGRFAANPTAQVEAAWMQFPIVEEGLLEIRAGLYDLPFSRDALTSDSKLLLMDRTLIKEALTDVGLADNTIGLMVYGRPWGGFVEYAFGIFDNVGFERAGVRESDELMPGGRLAFHILDSNGGYADYQGSYIGKGTRLDVGLNAAHLGDAIDGLAVFDLTAWGVDLYANSGPYTFQTEYDQIIEDVSGAAELYADGWYVQAGYLFDPCDPCTEFAVRYQELDPLLGDTLQWTSIGFNFYIREHNLKIQTDYTFRSGTVGTVLPGGLGLFDEDVFQVQLQLDF